VFGDAADGDFRLDAPTPELIERRRQLAPLPASAWTALRQVHGIDVVVVHRPGACDGAEADAAVTSEVGAVLSVTTADCAPVLLYSVPDATDDREVGRRPLVIGAAHAGWRGLYDGVLEATVAAMRELGAGSIEAVLGPCISPDAYEFGESDLTRLALRFGPDVVAATSDGRPAFDLRSGVRTALGSVGVGVRALDGTDLAGPRCTATGGAHHSWRAQRSSARQASIIWIEP